MIAQRAKHAAVIAIAWLMAVSIVVLAPNGAAPAAALQLSAVDGDACTGEDVAGDPVDGIVEVREYDGDWWSRGNDNDIIEAWGELYPDRALPGPTAAGYRYDVAVCVDPAGDIVGIDFEDLDLVAADDAQAWFNNALTGAVDGLDLKAPGWVSYPDRAHNQIVYLDTWFYVQEHWEPKTTQSENGEVRVTVTATPVGVDFRLLPQADGQAEIEFPKCVGRGEVWTPGRSGASSCSAPPWEHSTSILGPVEVRGRMEYQVVITQTTLDNDEANTRGGVTTTVSIDNLWGPWDTDDDTPDGSRYFLQVAEVQTYGLTGEAVAAPAPDPLGTTPGGDTIGVSCGRFDVWCRVIKPIGGVLVEFLVPDELIEALEACADAFGDAFGGFGDLLSMLNPANWGQIWDDFNALRDTLTQAQEEGRLISVLTDMAIEAGEEALQLDRLRDADGNWELSSENIASWIGYMSCDALIGFITGAAVDKIADFARVARRWKDKRDRGEDTGPSDSDVDGSTCSVVGNSFPPGTPVLMASGAYVAIEDIRPGDHVLSFDTGSRQWTPAEVIAQWSAIDEGALTTLTFADGSHVRSTDDHQFWIDGADAWVEADSIGIGQRVLTPAGATAVAGATTGSDAVSVVWELTVADQHNFVVSSGSVDVLVHNQTRSCGDGDDGIPEGGEANSWDEDGNPTTYIDEEGRIHDLRTPEQLRARVDEILDSVLNGDDTAVLGRFPEVAEAGELDGNWNLNVEDWSPELNDALMDGLVEAGDPITLVSDPFDPRHAGSVYETELAKLRDENGWRITDNGDGTWTAEPSWARPETLQDHFDRHGPDFDNTSPGDYAQGAADFYDTRGDFLTKTDSNGRVRVYDPDTNTFAVYNADGTTATYYKPDPAQHGFETNLEYWESQPGS